MANNVLTSISQITRRVEWVEVIQEYVVRLNKFSIELLDEILLNPVFLQQLGLVLLAQVLLAEGVHHVLQINAGSVDQLVGLK